MVELLPNWMQENCYPAQYDRLLLGNIVCDEGVADVPGGSLLVTTGGAGLQLSVAQGGAFVEGDDDDRGMYSVYNDAAVTVTATAADPTNPRIDTVVARVYDSTYGEGADEWVLEILAGTPTGGATLGNLNGAASTAGINALVLGYVLVPATFVGPFVNATHILDARVPWETCTVDKWHSVGATNEPAFSTTWANQGGAFQVMQFRKIDDVVELRGNVGGGATGTSVFTLPTGYRPPAAVRVSSANSANTIVGIDITAAGTVLVTSGTMTGIGIYTRFSVNA